MSNVLIAIKNLMMNQVTSADTSQNSEYKNRINNVGAALESLIKDSFCNTFSNDISSKHNIYSQVFSYIGNQNNPPDLIIKNGDAIEIKKIENKNAGSLALNSSFPKNKLYSDSSLITIDCKNCEPGWVEKDICYIVGQINKNGKIGSISFVYGDCYCAKPEVYTKIKNQVTDSILELGIECHKTNEIAKIKKVDPLGITDLRVRGMWSIQHPHKLFASIITATDKTYIMAIMTKQKFDCYDANLVQELKELGVVIKAVNIQNPNNPAQLIEARLIEYIFE